MNEDPTEKLIRELKEENERLKNKIKGGDVSEEELKDLAGKDGGESLSKEEVSALKKQWMEEMKATMKNNEKRIQLVKTILLSIHIFDKNKFSRDVQCSPSGLKMVYKPMQCDER